MALASLAQDDPRAHALQQIAAALEATAEALRLLAEQDRPTPPPSDDDPMLTVAEAAAQLQRSPAHVRARCRGGQIRAMRDGQDWRIRRSALAAYERRRTR